jgi:hypothetical protein
VYVCGSREVIRIRIGERIRALASLYHTSPYPKNGRMHGVRVRCQHVHICVTQRATGSSCVAGAILYREPRVRTRS